MTSAQLVPAIVIPLVLWRLYVRVRRNIGRQPWRAGRLLGRAIFFTVVVSLIGIAARDVPEALAALGGGLAVGGVIAALGVKLTRFETAGGEKFYTPNLYIGLAVTLLFVGRVVYRIMVLTDATARAGAPQFFQSPATLLIFGVTAGFYIVYAIAVFVRGRALPEAPRA